MFELPPLFQCLKLWRFSGFQNEINEVGENFVSDYWYVMGSPLKLIYTSVNMQAE